MLLSTFSGLYLTSPWLFCSYPFVSLIPSPFHPAPRPAPLWQSALYALTCAAWGLLSSFLGGPQNSHMSGVQAVPLRWPYFSSDSTRRPRVVGRPHSIWLVGMQTIPIPRIWDTVSLTHVRVDHWLVDSRSPLCTSPEPSLCGSLLSGILLADF